MYKENINLLTFYNTNAQDWAVLSWFNECQVHVHEFWMPQNWFKLFTSYLITYYNKKKIINIVETKMNKENVQK